METTTAQGDTAQTAFQTPDSSGLGVQRCQTDRAPGLKGMGSPRHRYKGGRCYKNRDPALRHSVEGGERWPLGLGLPDVDRGWVQVQRFLLEVQGTRGEDGDAEGAMESAHQSPLSWWAATLGGHQLQ